MQKAVNEHSEAIRGLQNAVIEHSKVIQELVYEHRKLSVEIGVLLIGLVEIWRRLY
ncbi:hypothetical protein [Saccharolobus solfataricus]|uniref:hypothetical protein n=1 Tax=Saccharolobus solfataricus TaxID=2287 RepID=UPI0001A7834F|nr:hypothetical protein [Saccharolobus solfataricus]